MPDCRVQNCLEHSGHAANITEFNEFKKTMQITIERLWSAIDKRVLKTLMVTFTILIIGIVTTLFGLVYESNQKVLSDMVDIQTNITLIMDKLNKNALIRRR